MISEVCLSHLKFSLTPIAVVECVVTCFDESFLNDTSPINTDSWQYNLRLKPPHVDGTHFYSTRAIDHQELGISGISC